MRTKDNPRTFGRSSVRTFMECHRTSVRTEVFAEWVFVRNENGVSLALTHDQATELRLQLRQLHKYKAIK